MSIDSCSWYNFPCYKRWKGPPKLCVVNRTDTTTLPNYTTSNSNKSIVNQSLLCTVIATLDEWEYANADTVSNLIGSGRTSPGNCWLDEATGSYRSRQREKVNALLELKLCGAITLASAEEEEETKKCRAF